MKKLYFLLAAAVLGISSVQARELTFYLGNTVIEAGSSVEFTDIEKETIGNKVEVYMEPKLYLQSDVATTAVTITAKANEPINLCAGGLCATGTEVEKTKVSLSADKKLDLEFHYEALLDADQDIPEVVTEFEALDTRYPETSVKFTLVMNPTSGVSTLIRDNSTFSAVNGGINYSFAAPAAVELYSITGARVLSTTLSGSGILSTSNLPKGIYVYTINGKSGKLYLR